MTAPSPEREAQVKRLAEALQDNAVWSPLVIAQKLYDAGARIPAPPAPVNPVSRETAANALNWWRAGEHHTLLDDHESMRKALYIIAPALLRDLAEAPKGPDGTVCFRANRHPVHLWPETVVRALTPGHAGERQ